MPPCHCWWWRCTVTGVEADAPAVGATCLQSPLVLVLLLLLCLSLVRHAAIAAAVVAAVFEMGEVQPLPLLL
jgi:hypothetical protein